ncbi:DUF3772 domain-containing protein [Sulfitobacter sp. SK012]|uniref:DUF3772 domain-containing protein n=1 Tax=Sulfitobacter sp. SK012 TaxID=1389005 RepID=UPI000E0C740D|nr:DUF3772 domain-containing protein [Sulfitobacter sp. SK012]AXI46456.1 DUF3772 domain-containing protein [Sulfitobacter sp. SK012]
MTRLMLRPFAISVSVTFALLWGMLAGAAFAQEQRDVNPAMWQSIAELSEAAVEDSSISDRALFDLRAQVVKHRAYFESARRTNGAQIVSLRQQIAALGDPPADGASVSEATEITEKREDLRRRLAVLLVPVQVAEAGFTRANGIVGQIDSIQRERKADQLVSVIASPLNPKHWGPALTALGNAVRGVWKEDRLNFEESGLGWRGKLPLVLGSIFLGVLLVARGRAWAVHIVGSLQQLGVRDIGVWRFLVSLLRIALPLIGLWLLVYALQQSTVLGPRSTTLISIIPLIGGVILGFRWVSERVFSRDDDEALILLSGHGRKHARMCITAITILIIVLACLVELLKLDNASATSITVLTFPITILMSLVLYRLGQLLRGYGVELTSDEDGSASAGTRIRVVRGYGSAALLVAVIAPLLQAAGYATAVQAFVPPFVMTGILLGLLMVLQRFSADVYGAVTGLGVKARDTLMPVFFGFLLSLAAIPLVALIWGAGVDDLSEAWVTFLRGVEVGGSQISPKVFLSFAVIFAIGYGLTRLLQSTLRGSVLPKTKMDIGGQNAIVSGLGYVGLFLAGLVAITGAGLDLSALAYVAGALSVGIGFGLQNVVSNFVSGIILLIERPISEGDWIEVGGQMGYVRDISVRSTRIETFDRTDVIVPNADLITGTVTNYTRGNTVGRVIIAVGVAYGTDTRLVNDILTEIASEQPMVLANPPSNVFFVNFGADALEFELRMYLRDVNWTMVVRNNVNHVIAERFAAEGIEIPFAQRDLWLRNPEMLRPGREMQASPPKSDKPKDD